MSRRNVGIIGCGHWGRNLVRTFNSLERLGGIYDAEPGRAQALAAGCEGVQVHDTFEDVLADPSIGAVVVATPAEAHHEMAMRAIEAGKDVFVEKPLALDWQEGIEMVEAARARGRILMVGHLLHYHPAVVRLKQLIEAGTLGRIEYIYSNRLSMGKIRREENALWSFAPHDISVLLSLVGQLPIQVTATGGAYLQPNIADVTVSHLLFDRGVRAHIFVSWLHPYKEQRLVVIGSRHMAVFEDSRPDRKLMLFNKQVELKPTGFEVTKPDGVVVDVDSSEPLKLECEHFLKCIDERTMPITPGQEGVRVLQVLQACQRSLQLNGEPVQVREYRQKVVAM